MFGVETLTKVICVCEASTVGNLDLFHFQSKGPGFKNQPGLDCELSRLFL